MSRKKRVWYPGSVFHVMSRGIRRNAIYIDITDYVMFFECLKRTMSCYEFNIYALCLMTNHFHLAIGTADVPLAKIMQKLLHSYSMEFNRKYQYSGHLFESRYTACLIENVRYFLEVSRYIHLNPVKAMIVKDPASYEYSSYGLFVHEKPKNGMISDLLSDIVDTSRILSYFQENSKEQYRMFVEEGTSHIAHEMQIQKEMNENDLWLP